MAAWHTLGLPALLAVALAAASDAWTYTANLESTYDWEREDWSVPLNLLVSKLLVVGSQRISLGGGVRYWLDEADNGPEGFGARAVITFLFPR